MPLTHPCRALRAASTGWCSAWTTRSFKAQAFQVVGQTYLLVMKAEDTGSGFYDQVTLWVDPLSDVEGAETIDGLSTGVGALNPGNIASIAMRTPFWETGDTFLFDNVVIGDSFADVVPTAVPEPASIAIWSLIGMGLAGFGYYRMRRKK